MKILLLEDDFDYQNSMKEYLESLNYHVDAFENGQEALDAIYEKSYHLLILDIRVPELSGYDIVKHIREDSNNTPVIFVTSLTDINNLSMGYELGCNDYIKKPFSVKELKYRVEQLIRMHYLSSNSNKIQINATYQYDLETMQLYKDKTLINLTKKEQEVIFTLLSAKNQFVSIESLRQEVWEDRYISESDIRGCIKNIRQKTQKDFIENRRGIGYKIARA